MVCLSYLHVVVGELQAFQPVELTSENFSSLVMTSNEAWLVMIKALSPEEETNQGILNVFSYFQDVSNKLQPYNIKSGILNCLSSKANQKLCKTLALTMTINIQLYTDEPKQNPYTKKFYRTQSTFTGAIDGIRTIEKFVAKNYKPSNIKVLNSIESFDNELSDFSRPKVAFFAEKSTVSLNFKSLAFPFQQSADFIYMKVDDEEEDIQSSKIDLSSIESPALIFMSSPDSFEKYEGDDFSTTDIDSVRLWLSSHITSSSPKDSDNSQSSEPSSSSTGTDAFLTAADLTESSIPVLEEWNILVTSTDDKKDDNADHTSLFKKLISSGGGLIKVVELRCETSTAAEASPSDSLGHFLCDIHKSKDFTPFLTTIPYGTSPRRKLLAQKNPKKWPISSISSDSIEGLVKSLGNTLPEDNVMIVDEAEFNDFLRNILLSARIPLLILSDKSTINVPTVIKNVAISLKTQTSFVIIQQPSDSFKASFGITKVPMVMALRPQVSPDDGSVAFQPIAFDSKVYGGMKFEALSHFVKSIFQSSYLGKNQDIENEKSSNSEKVSPLIVHEVFDNATWHENCPPAFRGICVVYLSSAAAGNNFFSNTSGISESVANANAVLKLIHIDGECKSGFADYFGIQSGNLPTVVVYSPFKNRYATFRGAVSEPAVKEFITAVMGGSKSTAPLSVRPVIDEGCSYAIDSTGDSDSAVGSEEASDFLAEILKEEQEKAASLKKIVDEERRKLAEEAKDKKKDKKDKDGKGGKGKKSGKGKKKGGSNKKDKSK